MVLDSCKKKDPLHLTMGLIENKNVKNYNEKSPSSFQDEPLQFG